MSPDAQLFDLNCYETKTSKPGGGISLAPFVTPNHMSGLPI